MLEIWPSAISPSSGQTKTSLLESWNPRKFVWKELRDLAYDLVGYFVVLLGPIMTVKKKNTLIWRLAKPLWKQAGIVKPGSVFTVPHLRAQRRVLGGVGGAGKNDLLERGSLHLPFK